VRHSRTTILLYTSHSCLIKGHMQHSIPSPPSTPFLRTAKNHDPILNPSNILAHLYWLQRFYDVKIKQKDFDNVYLAVAEQRYTLWLDRLHGKGYWKEGHKVPVPPIGEGSYH